MLLIDSLWSVNPFVQHLAAALGPQVELTVFTVASARAPAGARLRIVAAYPDFGGGEKRLAKSLRQMVASLRLLRELWRFRRDVVHVESLRIPRFELALLLAARPWLARVVTTAHSWLPYEPRRIDRLLFGRWYRAVDRIHTFSRQVKEEIGARFSIADDKFVVARLGRSAPVATTSTPGSVIPSTPPGSRRVLFFGTLREYKGIPDLLEAFERMNGDASAHLVIAGYGEPDFVERIRGLVAVNPKRERISLVPGWLSDAELAALIPSADIVVLPYRKVGTSSALMSAMGFGRAIVTTRIAAIEEYVVDGESALLCDPGDVASLSSALERLVTETELRERLGSEARRQAAAADWRATAEELVAAYAGGSSAAR